VTQTQIAALTDSNKMMTSKVLRTLEKKRYIYRRNNEKDSRAKTV
jgi:DNA-binding MarR family transcriptional regulator